MRTARWLPCGWSTEETTLKKVYYEGRQVRLQPANPTMSPIYVAADDVQVQGKVVLVIPQAVLEACLPSSHDRRR